MKYVVSGICRSSGCVTTREVDAADPLAAGSIASAGMIVFDVDPATAGEPERGAVLKRRGTPSPANDTARRLSFALSLLILAGLLAWSAHEQAPAPRLAGPSLRAADVTATTQPILPPIARAAPADRLGASARLPLAH
jgi:hypothetical protein